MDERIDLRKVNRDAPVGTGALQTASKIHTDHLVVDATRDGDFAKIAFNKAAIDKFPFTRPPILDLGPKFLSGRVPFGRRRKGRQHLSEYAAPSAQNPHNVLFGGQPLATNKKPVARQAKQIPKPASLTIKPQNMQHVLERLARTRDLLNTGETLSFHRLPNGSYQISVTGVNLEQAAIAHARIAENIADLSDGELSLARAHAKAKGKGFKAIQDLEPTF